MRIPIKIAVVEKDRERALMIIDGLKEAGNHEVKVFGDETGLNKKLTEFDPDLVLIDCMAAARDSLEELTYAGPCQGHSYDSQRPNRR